MINGIYSPFLQTDIFEDIGSQKEKTKVHIRLQQRSAKKCITIIEGLEFDDDEYGRFLKSLKKILSTNGTLKKKDQVLIFQGDQRDAIRQFLMDMYEYDEDEVIIHGF